MDQIADDSFDWLDFDGLNGFSPTETESAYYSGQQTDELLSSFFSSPPPSHNLFDHHQLESNNDDLSNCFNLLNYEDDTTNKTDNTVDDDDEEDDEFADLVLNTDGLSVDLDSIVLDRSIFEGFGFEGPNLFAATQPSVLVNFEEQSQQPKQQQQVVQQPEQVKMKRYCPNVKGPRKPKPQKCKCGIEFACKNELISHRIAKHAKIIYRCKWPTCHFHTGHKSNVVKHVRAIHLGLPRTKREQEEKNIKDQHDPKDYYDETVNKDFQ